MMRSHPRSPHLSVVAPVKQGWAEDSSEYVPLSPTRPTFLVEEASSRMEAQVLDVLQQERDVHLHDEHSTMSSAVAEFEARLKRVLDEDERLEKQEEKLRLSNAKLKHEVAMVDMELAKVRRKKREEELQCEDARRQAEKDKKRLAELRAIKRLYHRERSQAKILENEKAGAVRESKMVAKLEAAKLERERMEVEAKRLIEKLEKAEKKRQQLEKEVEFLTESVRLDREVKLTDAVFSAHTVAYLDAVR
uniref:Uncharacterized protein n=1 Tax=Palpitomonas bilix TaxID=652834 RepID=A0A7S3GHU1_9EUKA|mmetsp:Transcript_50156/g.129098  ORF Transcript_50156/g.129098 Transcript_50156/m.129098 type:complete len:249 (+) Transcript_50156:32-778(+)